jgi:hypothetical protein
LRQDEDVFEPQLRVDLAANRPANLRIGERLQNFLDDFS